MQSVYAHGDKLYCMVYEGGRWDARPVQCGPTNDKFFVIEQGLQEHDRVALNPRRFLDQVELPELPPEQQQRAVPQGARHAEVVAQDEDTDREDSAGTSASAGG